MGRPTRSACLALVLLLSTALPGLSTQRDDERFEPDERPSWVSLSRAGSGLHRGEEGGHQPEVRDAAVTAAGSSSTSGGEDKDTSNGGGDRDAESSAFPASSSSSSTEDLLREWLSQLVVTIPPQTVSKGFVKVTLEDLACTGFTMDSLGSDLGLERTAVGLAVQGAGCECRGTWAMGTARGGLTVEVGDGSSARIALSLSPPGEGNTNDGLQGWASEGRSGLFPSPPPGLPQLPTDASLDECATTVRVSRLTFTGSGAVPLRAFTPLIKRVVGRQLDARLCASLATTATRHLSSLMKGCDAAVAPRLRQPPPLPDPPLPPPPEVVYDWRRTPAVGLAGFLASSFARADGRFGLDAVANLFTGGSGVGWIDPALLPGGAGSKTPPLEFEIPAGGGGEERRVAGRVVVTLHSASLRGLNTANVLDGPSAAGASLLSLALGGEWMNITAAATVNITAGGGDSQPPGPPRVSAPPLVEHVTLDASVRSPLVRLRVAAVVNEAAVTGLTLQQRFALGCLAATVSTLELNAISVGGHLHHLHITPNRPGGLEGDVDKVVADVAALLAGRYARALTAAVSAAAGGPGRRLANAEIAALLRKVGEEGCPPPDAAVAGREAFKSRVSLATKWAAAVCIWGAAVVAAAAAVAAASRRRWLGMMARARQPGGGPYGQRRGGLAGLEAALVRDGQGDEAAETEGEGDEVFEEATGEQTEEISTPLLQNVGDDDPRQPTVGALVVEKGTDHATAEGSDSDHDAEVSDPDVSETDLEDESEDDVSLARSTRVPLWVKWALPLALVGNVMLFVSSNTAVGASVMLSAQLRDVTPSGSAGGAAGSPGASLRVGEEPAVPLTLTLPPLFDFTLANSVDDMWKAKVYPLSVLIAVFSGGWPYLKLALMLVAWVVPPRVMEVPRRGRLLGALDALGKWSLIDAFVMTLFLVAFRFHIQTPPTPVAEGDMMSRAVAALDVTVEPKWGFYSFLLATILSLMLGHVTLGWHRSVLESAAQGATATAAAADLRTRHVALWRRLRGGKRYRRFAGASVATCLAASAALVVFGARATSLRFDFKGLAGAVLGNSTNHREYSLLSLAASLPGASTAPHAVGVMLIQAALYTFALAMPLAQLALLAVLWLVPLSRSAQLKIATAAEVAGAWAALDVFLVAALAAVLQIKQFAAFIVGDSCNLVDAVLRLVAHRDVQGGGGGDPLGLKGDNVCFDVDTQLDNGCWILVPAAVVAVITGHVVTEACQSVLRRPLQELALTPRATPQQLLAAGWLSSDRGVRRRSKPWLAAAAEGNERAERQHAVVDVAEPMEGDEVLRGGAVAARLAAAAEELDGLVAGRDACGEWETRGVTTQAPQRNNCTS